MATQSIDQLVSTLEEQVEVHISDAVKIFQNHNHPQRRVVANSVVRLLVSMIG